MFEKLLQANSFIFVIVLSLFFILIALILNSCLNLLELYGISDFNIMPKPALSNVNNLYFYLKAIVLAPIFETFFFQALPVKLFRKITFYENYRFLFVIMVALFFSIIHFYSIFYMFYAFCMGLLFLSMYIQRLKYKLNINFEFIVVHAIVNTIFIFNEIHKICTNN